MQEPMPHKFNEPRRHKIPTAKYRVTNWPDYDAALVRRGALTVWFTDEAIAEWRAPATRRRGGSADLFSARHRNCPDNTFGVPPAAASDRRIAAVHCRCALVHEYPDTDRLPADEWHMEEANAGLVILMLEQ